MESSQLPPEFWQAQTRYRIEQMKRGEPTDLLSSMAWELIRGVFLVLTLPTRLAASRKLKTSSADRWPQPSEDPAMGKDARPTTQSTWKIRDA